MEHLNLYHRDLPFREPLTARHLDHSQHHRDRIMVLLLLNLPDHKQSQVIVHSHLNPLDGDPVHHKNHQGLPLNTCRRIKTKRGRLRGLLALECKPLV